MAQFETAYNKTARWEGGYQDNPNDTGNYNSLGVNVGTNWGINAKVYENWIGRPPTRLDMLTMSKTEAKQIYRQKFWNNIEGDLIQSQPLANILYDGRVNHGYHGVKMMQRILGVNDDGQMGPQTLNALNLADERETYLKYKQARTDFYHWLADNKPGQSVFLNGWLNRINSFNDFSNVPVMAGGIGFVLFLLAGGYLYFNK